LPAILERHPDTVYIVLGATHPHVKERDGETYRIMLRTRQTPPRGLQRSSTTAREPARAQRVPFPQRTSTSPYPAAADASGRWPMRSAPEGVISTPYLYACEPRRRAGPVPWRMPGDRSRGPRAWR
jgi:hypothetical protein